MNCQHLGATALTRLDTKKSHIYILEPPEGRPVFSQQVLAVCLKEHKYVYTPHMWDAL